MDKITKEQRSKVMGKIRAQSALENEVSKALWHRGIRFRKNSRRLSGTPDISIKKYKIVIFIDSCFWHVCPIHWRRPRSNQEFWDKKFINNIRRDLRVDSYYQNKGWHLMRVWEHQIRGDFDRTIDDIAAFIDGAKRIKSHD